MPSLPSNNDELDRARNSRPLLGCAFLALLLIVLIVVAIGYVLWSLFVGPDFPN
jgi:hypothetical protein